MKRFAYVLLLFAVFSVICWAGEVSKTKGKSTSASSAKQKKDTVSAAVAKLLEKADLAKLDSKKVEQLQKLKVDLKESKAKAKALGLSIRKAAPEASKKLKTEKKEISKKCVALKQEIANTKAQLKKLQDDYATKCANQLEIKIQKAKKRILFLTPKIKEIHVKCRRLKVSVKKSSKGKKTRIGKAT